MMRCTEEYISSPLWSTIENGISACMHTSHIQQVHWKKVYAQFSCMKIQFVGCMKIIQDRKEHNCFWHNVGVFINQLECRRQKSVEQFKRSTAYIQDKTQHYLLPIIAIIIIVNVIQLFKALIPCSRTNSSKSLSLLVKAQKQIYTLTRTLPHANTLWA